MESLGNDDLSIVLLFIIIIIIRSSSSYNRGHNLLKHFRKTQHKLIRLMKTSIASLPSLMLNVGFASLLHLGYKRLLNQHWKEREGKPRKRFNNYDRDRGVHTHSCIKGNQGKMMGNSKICTGIQSQLILPEFTICHVLLEKSNLRAQRNNTLNLVCKEVPWSDSF